MDKKQRKKFQFSFIYLIVALLGIWLFQDLIFRPVIVRWQEVPYSQFRQTLAEGNVEEVTLGEDRIFYTCCVPPEGDQEGQLYNVVRLEDPDLVQDLLDAGVSFSAEAPTSNLLTTLLGWVIPLLPLALIWYFVFRRMGQGGAGIMSIGKSKAREIAGELTGVEFDDVGGVDEVEVELKEIIQFLKNPERFTRLGAKLPKGVLLVGPPGTGKTLLARATAGEAGVPFSLSAARTLSRCLSAWGRRGCVTCLSRPSAVRRASSLSTRWTPSANRGRRWAPSAPTTSASKP